MSDPVSILLSAIEAGVPVPPGALADDVVLDATVALWRLTRHGADEVRAQFATWYADPAAFEELTRTPVPGGEVVRFLLTWIEGGVPHAAHQVHLVEVVEGQIVKHTVFCGGRWDAGLLAEMEEARRVSA